MIDDASRTRSNWRERALAATRRRLKRLEIETHRIKAELARLESANETDIADELSHELREDGVEVAAFRVAESSDRTMRPRPNSTRLEPSPLHPAVRQSAPAPTIDTTDHASTNGAAAKDPRRVLRRRAISPAWWLSLGLHAAVIAILAPMTYVILTNDEMPLFASMFDFETSLDEPGAVPIEMASFEEVELEEVSLDAAAGLSDGAAEEFSPLASELGGELASSLGQLDTLPTDVGTLMAGGGSGEVGSSGGRGAAGDEARLGTASFFGTSATGQSRRVPGRQLGQHETGPDGNDAVLSSSRSVESDDEKQQFYVCSTATRRTRCSIPTAVTGATAPRLPRKAEAVPVAADRIRAVPKESAH